MTPEKRKNELLFGLNRTGTEEVYVDYNHVVECLGEAKAKDLCNFKGCMQQANSPKNANSLIPEEKRITSFGISGFNKVKLIEALSAKPAAVPKT